MEATNEEQNTKCKTISPENVTEIHGELKSITDSLGLEAYPFKIGWYNDAVKPAFKLEYNADTLAFVIVSVPQMFEQCLLPFLQADKYDCSRIHKDPLDQCMTHCFNTIKDHFKDFQITEIHDYDIHANRRPKILVQTCGHIAGAAYYYQPHEIKNLPISNRKLFGVSIHPKYGGWFAFRGVLIFENVFCPGLMKKEPEDVVKSDELKLELLKRFNGNWKDWSFRDIISPAARYSEDQKLFFSTPPSEREALIKTFETR
eukprot:gene7795-8641_t